MATAKKTASKTKKEKITYYGTGRRKTSIARVFLTKGKGKITVNNRGLDNYFGRETSRMIVHQPLVVADMLGKFDIVITVKGGGSSSQAGAIRLGIARALLNYEENTMPAQPKSAAKSEEGVLLAEGAEESAAPARGPLRTVLRKNGLLTRDSRIVERKKVGRHKARKGTQYSKR